MRPLAAPDSGSYSAHGGGDRSPCMSSGRPSTGGCDSDSYADAATDPVRS
jgi:hypothetical protein